MTEHTCVFDGCDHPQLARGVCSMHYQRWSRHRDPEVAAKMLPHRTPESRFWPKVDKTPTCWLWTGATTRRGYGQFGLGGTRIQAHRFAYELLVGPIPEGLQVDHLCRVRHCVNPDHLEPVTGAENVRRGLNGVLRSQTHCVNGHERTDENTYRRPRNGYLVCRICRRSAGLKYLARRRDGGD